MSASFARLTIKTAQYAYGGINMIQEDYVSFEVAKLLKEKEFDEPCTELNKLCLRDGKKPVLKVTHQKAMKWLREVHGIFIAINNDDLVFNWQCYDLINRGSTLDPKILSESYAGYKTYEQAVEAALKYCLENLI